MTYKIYLTIKDIYIKITRKKNLDINYNLIQTRL